MRKRNIARFRTHMTAKILAPYLFVAEDEYPGSRSYVSKSMAYSMVGFTNKINIARDKKAWEIAIELGWVEECLTHYVFTLRGMDTIEAYLFPKDPSDLGVPEPGVDPF